MAMFQHICRCMKKQRLLRFYNHVIRVEPTDSQLHFSAWTSSRTKEPDVSDDAKQHGKVIPMNIVYYTSSPHHHKTSQNHNFHPLFLAIPTSCLTAKSAIISSLPPPTTIILKSLEICSTTFPL